jgi:hypothetical protein
MDAINKLQATGDNSALSAFDPIAEDTSATVEATEELEETPTSSKSADKAAYATLKAQFTKQYTTDEAFREAIDNPRSDDIECVGVIAYGDKGGMQNKDKVKKGADGKHGVSNTSDIVGYKFKNVGESPITYRTFKSTKHEDGTWNRDIVSVTAQPEQEMILPKWAATELMARIEYSFRGKNFMMSAKNLSKLIAESTPVGDEALITRLSKWFVRMKKGTFSVQDDNYKKNISVPEKDAATGKTKWVVVEHVDTFGYLNDPSYNKKSGSRKRNSQRQKVSNESAAANYLRELIAKSESIEA